MSRITCCYKCEERTLGCHATCERYIEQSKANAKRREQEFNERQIKNVITGLHDKRINSDSPKKIRNRIR